MKHLYLPYLLCVFALLFAGISCSKEGPYPDITEEEAVYLYGASYYGDIYGNGTSDFFVAFESGDYAETTDDRDGDGVEEYYITNGFLLYVDVIAEGSTKLPPDGKYPFSFGCEGGTFGGVEYYTIEGDSSEYERTMTYRTDRMRRPRGHQQRGTPLVARNTFRERRDPQVFLPGGHHVFRRDRSDC